jgi:hypothetical protein
MMLSGQRQVRLMAATVRRLTSHSTAAFDSGLVSSSFKDFVHTTQQNAAPESTSIIDASPI